MTMKYQTSGFVVMTEQSGGDYLGSVCERGVAERVKLNEQFKASEYVLNGDSDDVVIRQIRGGSSSYQQLEIDSEQVIVNLNQGRIGKIAEVDWS